MATIEAKWIQGLLDSIERLRTAIRTAGDEGRAKLETINVDEVCSPVRRDDGGFDDTAWANLSENQQRELHHQLVQVRDSLHDVASLDGPTDPRHIMYGSYASNWSIVLWTVVSLALVVVLLTLMITRWDQATRTDYGPKMRAAIQAVAQLDSASLPPTDAAAAANGTQRSLASADEGGGGEGTQAEAGVASRETDLRGAEVRRADSVARSAAVDAVRAIDRGATEKVVLLMVTVLGALGGSFHLVASLVKYIGNRQLKRSWLLYYLSLPFIGAALAPTVYMLLRVGILSPPAAANGGSATADLNLVGIYAFAVLTGMFAGTATDKLREVFTTVFRTERNTKDPIGSHKPPGAASEPAAGAP